jgi:hypothetical protein
MLEIFQESRELGETKREFASIAAKQVCNSLRRKPQTLPGGITTGFVFADPRRDPMI